MKNVLIVYDIIYLVSNTRSIYENNKKTPSAIYLMHKYFFGKKTSDELKEQVLKYAKKNDLILDPFAGYGGIGIESIIKVRNVILNDLNHSANFISDCILEKM